MTGLATRRVSPFGHPGLTGCVRLPPAFRSLPRPSSPPYTQASPARSRSLDYKICSEAKHAHYFLRNASSLSNREHGRRPYSCTRKGFVSHDLPVPSFFKQRAAWNCSGRQRTNAFELVQRCPAHSLTSIRGEPSIVRGVSANFNRHRCSDLR